MTTLATYYLYLNSFLYSTENEEGQSLAEYGLILALVAVVCIAAVSLLGSTINYYLRRVASGF